MPAQCDPLAIATERTQSLVCAADSCSGSSETDEYGSRRPLMKTTLLARMPAFQDVAR